MPWKVCAPKFALKTYTECIIISFLLITETCFEFVHDRHAWLIITLA